MSETLKKAVLAKCGELNKECYDGYVNIKNGKFKQNFTMGYILDGVNFTVHVCPSAPENDYSWILAAQILGIAKPEPRPFDHEAHASEVMDQLIAEIGSDFDTSVLHTVKKLLKAYRSEPRPSDGLLWEAFKAGISHSLIVLEGSRQNENESFTQWLTTLPADPLADELRFLQNENATLRGELDFFQSRDTLADDRELVGNSLRAGYIRVGTEGQQITFEFAVKVCEAIKRLAGMEVNRD